jgi:hypothetical protein
MNSAWTGFRSIVAQDSQHFLANKRSLGRRFEVEEKTLRLLDRYLVELKIEHAGQLTADQVHAFGLPPRMKAKEESSTYKRFVAKHGEDVFELEAVEPAELQRILTEAIDSVLDIGAFNRELDAEKRDAAFLETQRRRVLKLLGPDGTGPEATDE